MVNPSVQPRVLAAVTWHSHRSGNWICEVYNKRTGKFISCGIGRNQSAAQARAFMVAQQNQSPDSVPASPQ
jgi:hypothetical protein